MVEKLNPPIYGIPIEVLPLNEDGVPYFLPVVVNKILDNILVEGLFRLGGRRKTIDELGIAALDVNFKVEDDITIYDVTSFLKQWIRELPIPLITPSVINEYFKDTTMESTKEVLRHLAPVNRKCLAMIFSLLALISDQSQTNLMTISNLFVCILPSIMQNFKDIEVRFSFQEFFDHCIELMNVDGNDFLLDKTD